MNLVSVLKSSTITGFPERSVYPAWESPPRNPSHVGLAPYPTAAQAGISRREVHAAPGFRPQVLATVLTTAFISSGPGPRKGELAEVRDGCSLRRTDGVSVTVSADIKVDPGPENDSTSRPGREPPGGWCGFPVGVRDDQFAVPPAPGIEAARSLDNPGCILERYAVHQPGPPHSRASSRRGWGTRQKREQSCPFTDPDPAREHLPILA